MGTYSGVGAYFCQNVFLREGTYSGGGLNGKGAYKIMQKSNVLKINFLKE